MEPFPQEITQRIQSPRETWSLKIVYLRDRHLFRQKPKAVFTTPTQTSGLVPGSPNPEPPLGHGTHHFFNTILFQRVPVWAAISFFRSPMVSSVLAQRS